MFLHQVASISQLSFMVRPDSFERGQLRLTCISTVHSVYSEQAELVINEERPQIASVLGTRDGAEGKLLIKTTTPSWKIILKRMIRCSFFLCYSKVVQCTVLESLMQSYLNIHIPPSSVSIFVCVLFQCKLNPVVLPAFVVVTTANAVGQG